MSDNQQENVSKDTPTNNPSDKYASKVKIGAYISLIFAILYFSGLLTNVEGYKWLSALDFTTLIGKYGTIAASGKDTFIGHGGSSARAGFLFALSLIPSIMLALGTIEVLAHYGALKAAHKLLTPLLRPLLGVPGLTGLALITDLQSTDAGAALTKELYDEKLINRKELTTIAAWQYSGAGMINNYFAIVSALFAMFTVPVLIPLIIIFVLKFVGGIICRICLTTIYRKDFKNEQ